jgi:hypothetical protein
MGPNTLIKKFIAVIDGAVCIPLCSKSPYFAQQSVLTIVPVSIHAVNGYSRTLPVLSYRNNIVIKRK